MDQGPTCRDLFIVPARAESLPHDVLVRSLAIARKADGNAMYPEAATNPFDLSECMGGRSYSNDSPCDICPRFPHCDGDRWKCTCDSANILANTLGGVYAGETLNSMDGSEDEDGGGQQVNSATSLGCGEGEEDERLQEEDGPLTSVCWQERFDSIKVEDSAEMQEPATGSSSAENAVPLPTQQAPPSPEPTGEWRGRRSATAGKSATASDSGDNPSPSPDKGARHALADTGTSSSQEHDGGVFNGHPHGPRVHATAAARRVQSPHHHTRSHTQKTKGAGAVGRWGDHCVNGSGRSTNAGEHAHYTRFQSRKRARVD